MGHSRAHRGRGAGVDHEAIEGSWPDQATAAASADVVVSHHVAYNVVELTGEHPRAGVNHLWRHFWDVDRPSGPTAGDAVAGCGRRGSTPAVEQWPRRGRGLARAERVASVRVALPVPARRRGVSGVNVPRWQRIRLLTRVL